MSTKNNQEKTIGEVLYTVDQAAELLQLHPVTVRRMIARGDLRAIHIGKTVRVPAAAIYGTPIPNGKE